MVKFLKTARENKTDWNQVVLEEYKDSWVHSSASQAKYESRNKFQKLNKLW